MSSGKIAKALIGGNWKCNGTVASVKQLVDTLNNAGSFSANSEVVIAAPSIHLSAVKAAIRTDISIASQVSKMSLISFHICDKIVS
jgi:triosephosphate isomerase